ncbi:MAG: aldehyde dehydrogenase [Planctomycetota bacterium]|nr:MAG: aldehyde dehydrogenase [Planctomycetota bacterium]
MRTLSNYIGGSFVPPQSSQFLDDFNPATGERIARVPRSGAADVDAAVAAARNQVSASGRAELLEKIADGIEQRAEELAQLESQDTGKPVALARSVDIPRAILNFRFFAGAVRHDQTACHEMAGALNYTLRRPLGVVGLITPWNLPLYLLTWKTAPALGMGNSVVAKPSELTPLTAQALAEIIHDAGAPRGAFNLVHGLGPEAGQALVGHPGVAAISFTGGTATGAKVAASAAPQFKKLSLELGGKNPTVVFADADFEAAIAGTVRAGFLNQGQVCLCGSRVLVERKIYERFVEALVARVRSMKIGDPGDPKTELGALISPQHRDKVEGYVRLAKQEGGAVLCGGERPSLPPPVANGAFLAPTVIAGLSPSCRTATEEIFGPVVTVHPFDSEEEAVSLANGVRYGLAASVWTTDLARAHRVAGALAAGVVWVNCWLLRDLRTPFGGVKDSGVGREGGQWSLDFFSEVRNVCVALPAP